MTIIPPLIQSVKELQVLYDKGINIAQYLREKYGGNNSPKVVEFAYDLQAGTYCEHYMRDEAFKNHYKNIAMELSNIVQRYYPNASSILEAGIGEGNCIGELLNYFNGNVESAGFDISWSRLAYARKWLNDKGYKKSTLFTGDLLDIPCAENSFDIVYTNQAVEPNRGSEEKIIRELYRVARKYLIMIEPSYELASEEAKKRMDAHGYVRGLESIAKENNYNVIEYRLSPYYFNPLNPTAIMVIEKGGECVHDFKIACPQFKSKLENIDGALYSAEAMRVYPIINGIPCLRIESGIVASKYELFAKEHNVIPCDQQ